MLHYSWIVEISILLTSLLHKQVDKINVNSLNLTLNLVAPTFQIISKTDKFCS